MGDLRHGSRALAVGLVVKAGDRFNGNTATVTIEAAYAKNRRRDELPINSAVALQLQMWLAD